MAAREPLQDAAQEAAAETAAHGQGDGDNTSGGGEDIAAAMAATVRSARDALEAAVTMALRDASGSLRTLPKDGAIIDGAVFYRPERSLHLVVPSTEEDARAAMGVTEHTARLSLTRDRDLQLVRMHDGEPSVFLVPLVGRRGLLIPGDDGTHGWLSSRGGALCWNGEPVAPPLTADVKAHVDLLAKNDAAAGAKEAAAAAADGRPPRRTAASEATAYAAWRRWRLSRMVVEERKVQLNAAQRRFGVGGGAPLTPSSLDSAPCTPSSGTAMTAFRALEIDVPRSPMSPMPAGRA
jgi:hypothetical protein